MIHIYGIAAALAFLIIATKITFFIKAKRVRIEDQFIASEFISKELIVFLEKADDAYILTHETIEISYFSKYVSNNACLGVLEAIYKNPPLLFGTKRYRKRSWSYIKQDKNGILLQKKITHTQIEVKKGIKIALGDEIVEVWRISFNLKVFTVEDIS